MMQLKPLHDNVYIALSQIQLVGIAVPKHAIIYKNEYEHTLYICTHFPKNYAGRAKNVRLLCQYYDYMTYESNTVELCHNVMAARMFKAWENAFKPRAKSVYHEPDYSALMKHDRKRKNGSGGVRLNAYNDTICTEQIKYKQVTEAAYFANLNNAKSGNASVVASGIKLY